MAVNCYKDLVQYGANDILEREYKSMTIKPEQGYDFTIEINLEQLPPSQGIFLLFFKKEY
jgi:actin related protein 2/3 complex subunit 2